MNQQCECILADRVCVRVCFLQNTHSNQRTAFGMSYYHWTVLDDKFYQSLHRLNLYAWLDSPRLSLTKHIYIYITSRLLLFWYLSAASREREREFKQITNMNFKSTTYQLLIYNFPENPPLGTARLFAICSQHAIQFFSLVLRFIQYEYLEKRFSIESEGLEESTSAHLVAHQLWNTYNNYDFEVTSRCTFLREGDFAAQTTPR